MHELSIVVRFTDMAADFAKEHHAKEVKQVTLEVGALTGVEPKYLLDYYPDVVRGTILEGSKLVVEEVEGRAFCTECATVYNPLQTDMKCPSCGSQACNILEGKELILKEIGFVD